jgi:cytochrome c2
MRASTMAFLIFCGWFVVFKMFPFPPEAFEPTVCGVSDMPKNPYPEQSGNPDQLRGKLAFEVNCARCHSTHLEKPGTGPALLGVTSRIPGGDWIYRWVSNSAKMVQEGDPYAVKVYNANGKVNMDPFPALPKETIDDIMAYIDGYILYTIE